MKKTMSRYAFGAKKKATKKAPKKRAPKKATRKLSVDQLKKRLCRVSHAPGPRCKSEVRYDSFCKSAKRCRYFRITAKGKKNHMLALVSAYSGDDAKLKDITKHMTKKEIQGLAKEMKKQAQKFKEYSAEMLKQSRQKQSRQ